MPVIDLGLDRDVVDLDPGGRSRFRRAVAFQRWALAGCLALVLLTVTAAAPLPRPSLFLVRAQPPAGATGYALVEDELLVMTGDGQPALSAYRARDGRLLWSAPATGSWLTAMPAGNGLVLVVTQLLAENCCVITAYDRANGQARWSRRADLSDIDLDGDRVAIAVGESKLVLEVSSGRVLWRDDAAVVRIVGPRDILLANLDGTAERRDLNTDVIQARGRIFPEDHRLAAIAMVDGRLIVGFTSASRSATVTAYDVDTLRPVWTRSGRVVDETRACGPVLCLRAGYGLQAVDPRTGVVRWQQSDWFAVEQGGRVLAFTLGPNRLRAVGTVDPSTGKVVLDLGGWDTNLKDNRDTELVLTRTVAGQTTVAVADLTSLVIHVLGVIPDVVVQCQAGHGHLACQDSGGRLKLWAYRRPPLGVS